MTTRLSAALIAAAGLFLGGTGSALADDAATPPASPTFESGNIAWMLTSSALVLMMTAPGLALFYGGLVRKKNILSVMMQCLSLMGLMSIVWALWGYSFAFGNTSNPYVGNLDYVLLRGVIPTLETPVPQPYPAATAIPHVLWMVYQGMFFIITPALICGAFAERMKFSTMCVFLVLWGTFIYCPLAHWVWSPNGWLGLGSQVNQAMDFAGGTVVHISSGVSALVCALVMGRRLGFGQEPMPPHNLTYTCVGAALLWVGWFGFNAGSALAAGNVAVNAFVATHLAASAGLLAWSAAEWIWRGKPSALGACSGAVAGLVCITPAAGFVNPISGIILGLAAGFVCFYACTRLKNTFKYDDALDAFGVHGVGGALGALLTGVFSTTAVNPDGISGMLEGNPSQLVKQAVGAGVAIGAAFVGTLILLKALDVAMGLRVTQDDELRGLDLADHGEEGYIFL